MIDWLDLMNQRQMEDYDEKFGYYQEFPKRLVHLS